MFPAQLIHRFTEHADQVRGVAWSPNGEKVVSCSADGMARLYNVMPRLSAQAEQSLNHPGEILYDVAWSPDGRFIALASSAQAVWIWDTIRKHQEQLGGHRGQTFCLTYSPLGDRLSWGAQDGSAYLWNPQDRQLVGTLEHGDTVRGLAFSPDGRILATGAQNGLVSFFDARTGEPLGPTFQEAFWVTCVAFSPDGTLLAYGLESGEIICIDMATGQCSLRLAEHSAMIWRLVFSPDGRLLASGSEDATIGLWEISTGRQLSLTRQLVAALALAFAPTLVANTYRIAVGSFDGSLSLYSYAL